MNASIIYTSCLWDKSKRPADARRQAKRVLTDALINYLCDPLLGADGPLRKMACSRESAYRVTRSYLGQPQLRVNGARGPSISFTHGRDRTWGAISLCGDAVGIDIASSLEFYNGYPYQFVFHQDEFQSTMRIFGTNENTAAALWSVKEAVVKSLGCGYHFFTPLDLKVRFDRNHAAVAMIFVFLSHRAKRRIHIHKESIQRVIINRKGTLFLSLALTGLQKS